VDISTGETYSFGIGFFNLYLIKTDILGNSGCNQQNANTITTNKIFQSINTPIITASGGLASSPDTLVNTGGTQTNICATLATSNLFYPNKYNLVYPNPFTDIITINLKEFNTVTIATIMDISGKQLLVCEVNSKKNTIDLSVLKSGIYFCQLKSITKTETVKIIKQ
jgi:Secretion system C-terminal sorting domain